MKSAQCRWREGSGWSPHLSDAGLSSPNHHPRGADVAYELDRRSALDLYETYLGDHADLLPGSAFLFPIVLRGEDGADHILAALRLGDDRLHDQAMTITALAEA